MGSAPSICRLDPTVGPDPTPELVWWAPSGHTVGAIGQPSHNLAPQGKGGMAQSQSKPEEEKQMWLGTAGGGRGMVQSCPRCGGGGHGPAATGSAGLGIKEFCVGKVTVLLATAPHRQTSCPVGSPTSQM